MNFLLVNDDGIDSEGLHALAVALSEKGKVYVAAPSVQQSGMSHSISLMGSITIKEEKVPCAERAWRVNGTPADCTKVGVQRCQESGIEIDIVFSGINKGSNLGSDTLYSGTVGAAIEGALQGYHAVAVSVNDHDAKYFDGACDLAVQVIDKVMELPTNIVTNINAPNCPKDQIKGVRYPVLGPSYFVDCFVPAENGEYVIKGEVGDYAGLGEGIDVGANALGYATITPLQYDFTSEEYLDTVKNWNINI